jgi:uncharacterized repeat protein (TIGR01451 family)
MFWTFLATDGGAVRSARSAWKIGVLVSSLLFLGAVPSLSVTTTDLNSTTPQQLAQLLAGPGVTVSNVTFTGANVAGGSFSGGLADGLGIDSGVILSSGNVANAAGPNDSDSVTSSNGTPGDTNLDAIVGKGQTTFDAAVLEFDFVPAASTVSFRYVFASDEYNEFVGSFNDVFAFFIDGQNVALIPGTTTPVAINTVNLETNSAFYRNNDPSDLGTPTPFATQFDGFTTVLTAAATLTPNASHHIKLAIADTDDLAFDSAVFLQAASFVAQNLTISKTAPSSVASGSNLTYTITYGNASNTSATNVVIEDPLPTGTSFVSATNGGQLSEGGVVTWNVGTLPAETAGATVSFTVHVNATSGSVDNVNYTIRAQSVSPVTGAPVSTTITQVCPAIALSPSTLPGGVVGSLYEATITASGGSPSYTFSVVSGSLPPGLELSSPAIGDLPIVAANLSGTPTAAGTFTFRIQAVDANACAGSRTYTIVVESSGGCGAVGLSPSVLFDGFVGTAYGRTIRGVGGTAPYRFSVTSGSLPPGLTLSSGGDVSGTPTAVGTFTFRVRVVDSNECAASRSYTVTISCPPVALSPATLPPAAQGVPYSQTITALGRHGPYTVSVTGGALPSGLALLPSGSFSGAAAEVGTFSFTVTVTDANGCTSAQSYTLTVCAALTISPAALPGAIVGVIYSQTIVASGGTAPYTYAQTGLPPPMTLSPTTGLLSGIPTATGTFNVTVTATDANGCVGVANYILQVCPNLTLSPAFFPQGSAGTFYSQTLVASGGTPPYLYTAVGLPSFFTVSETTGVLSGTAPTAGAINFTATATDANGCSVSRDYAIVVADAPPVIADLTLSPAGPDGFTLSIAGTGFVEGAVVIINDVSYPATFISPMLLTVVLPASAIPATGSITATVTNPGTTGGTSNPATLTFCDPPGAPLDPTIEPAGNATAPPTGTDFLRVRWEPPASGPAPASYEFRINGDPYTVVVGATSAVVPPRGSNDPMTLFVRAHCNADVAGPEVASPTYSLAPPVANFTFSAARVGSPVNFTDTSSPQATSWLWIFDDGDTSTLQSPMHTFTTAGTHRVALIASNGSGSSQVIKEIAVSPSTSGGGAVTSSVRAFETADGGRWSLPGVKLAGSRHAWLALTSSETEETIVYLRLLDSDGLVVLERRLAIAPGQLAVNDVGAYGVEGTHNLEIVSSRPVVASLSQPDKQPSFGEGPR